MKTLKKVLITIIISVAVPLQTFAKTDCPELLSDEVIEEFLRCEILPYLKTLESGNDPLAEGDNGRAKGILQIHYIVVREVNDRYNTSYTHSDMYIIENSEDVLIKYLSYGIKRFHKVSGGYPGIEEVVRFWNGGIYRGHKYKSTKEYYNRFLEVKERKR